MLSRLIAVPAVCLALSTLAGCGDSEPDTASEATTVSCDYPSHGASAAKPVEKPSSQAPKQGDVTVTIATGVGDIHATLDSDAAPCTVNSFLSLAEQGYFDDTNCHRLVPGFVLQCGDPTGTGGGGPGYTLPNEVTGDETYTPGMLAMANVGGDAATGGSQFFIMIADAPQLPAQYTVFGQVDAAGLKVVQDVAAQGTADGGPDGAPKATVTINSVG